MKGVCVLVWCSSSNSGGNYMCVSTAQCVLEKHDTWFPSAALPNVTEPRDCLTFTFNSCLLKSAGMPVCVCQREGDVRFISLELTAVTVG